MSYSEEQSKNNLIKMYLNLVRKGIQIQQKGDILAYTHNAIQAEQVAQKLQALARSNKTSVLIAKFINYFHSPFYFLLC